MLRDPRLLASAEWYLAHGLGNDYLVFPEGDAWPVVPETVRRVCDRHLGLGSDGIVVPLHREGPRFPLRMFNPDGSEFERSGNGLRVLAAWARTTAQVADRPFEAEVGGDRVTLRVHDVTEEGVHDVSVEMGRTRISAGAVGFRPGEGGAREEEGEAGEPRLRIPLGEGEEVLGTPVSVGNPHCVVFADDPTEAALERIGPALTGHPAFAEGVNVQLAAPLGPGRVRALIWERGVGRTTSSGTSSCAVAAAAVRRGLVETGEVEVVMEGGSFRVTVEPGGEVTLRGPVQGVARGRLDDGLLRSLRGPGG